MIDQKVKQTIEYIFPPVLLDTVRALRVLPQYLELRKDLKQNLVWRNAYLGEKVYVLGNGPSLSCVNRSLFRGHRVIVMNSFDRADWKDEFEIVAHCLGEPRLSPSWDDHIFYRSINGTKSASYWLHFSSKDHLCSKEHGKDLNYVLPVFEPGICPKRKIALHSAALAYQTTAQLAIQVALYLGFSEIYLLGFEHDWLASPEYSKHFYSSNKDQEDTLGRHSYLSIINFAQRMWNIYYKLQEISEAHNARIYNMTENSYLDVFPQVALPSS